nr:unnamed protein product [Digitaria exilis]
MKKFSSSPSSLAVKMAIILAITISCSAIHCSEARPQGWTTRRLLAVAETDAAVPIPRPGQAPPAPQTNGSRRPGPPCCV